MRWTLAIVIAVAACSHPKPAATPPPPTPTTPTAVDAAAPPPSATPTDAELEAMFEGMLTLVEDLATAAQAHRGQCPAMADAITAAVDSHAAVLKQARTYEGNPDIDAKGKAYLAARKDRTEAAANAFGDAFATCAQDAKVTAALARIDEM